MPELFQAVRILEQVKLFQGLDRAELAAVARAAQSVEVKRATFFFRQGTRAETIFVLRRGRVKLSQETPEGQEVVFRIVGPGEIFGPTATLKDRLYPVTAQAVSSCQALAWEGKTMVRLMEEYSRIALNTIEDLSAHIEELRERYRELATQRVERRVARTLLRLAHQAGWDTEEGVLIDMPLSRQDLAEMTGTTLYTVSRILQSWQRNGLVNAGRQRVTIVRSPGLRAIADEQMVSVHIAPAGSLRRTRSTRSKTTR